MALQTLPERAEPAVIDSLLFAIQQGIHRHGFSDNSLVTFNEQPHIARLEIGHLQRGQDSPDTLAAWQERHGPDEGDPDYTYIEPQRMINRLLGVGDMTASGQHKSFVLDTEFGGEYHEPDVAMLSKGVVYDADRDITYQVTLEAEERDITVVDYPDRKLTLDAYKGNHFESFVKELALRELGRPMRGIAQQLGQRALTELMQEVEHTETSSIARPDNPMRTPDRQPHQAPRLF